MRITKSWLKRQRDSLMVRVSVIGKMSLSEMIADIKVTCGWDASRATAEEIRSELLKWAVRDAIPDSTCE